MPAGSSLAFTCAGPGLYWEGTYVKAKDEVEVEVIELEPSAEGRIHLIVNPDEKVRLLRPVPKGGTVESNEIGMVADKRGSIILETPEEGVWIRIGDGSIRRCPMNGATFILKKAAPPDQAAVWREILEYCSPDGVHRVVDLRGVEVGIGYRFKDGEGKLLSTWSPIKGVHILADRAGNPFTLELQGLGVFLRQTWQCVEAWTLLLKPATLVKPSFKVKVTNPAGKSRPATVLLYEGGAMKDKKQTGWKDRIPVPASPDGSIACIVPDGEWWVSVGDAYRKVVVKGKAGTLVSIVVP